MPSYPSPLAAQALPVRSCSRLLSRVAALLALSPAVAAFADPPAPPKPEESFAPRFATVRAELLAIRHEDQKTASASTS